MLECALSLKLEVGEIPISNGEINKDLAFAQVQAKITNTRDGEFDICQKNNMGVEIKEGHVEFTCNAKTNSEFGGGNKRRKKSKKTKKKKITKKRKTMKKK